MTHHPTPPPYDGPVLVAIPAATLTGVEGRPIQVEVHHATGVLPGFQLVGLPDNTGRETRDRVRAALISSGFPWPTGRITVNLAPAGLTRLGAGLDLALAIGILATTGWIDPAALENKAFLSELGLDGSLRPVPGALALIEAIDEPEVIVPLASVNQAQLTGRHTIRTAANLRALVASLNAPGPWPAQPDHSPAAPADGSSADLGDIRGFAQARYALEVAAAGSHHLLLIGSPGSGKIMLARRLPGLLPDLTHDQALEVTRIHSTTGAALPAGTLITRPPFRAPGAGASTVSLIGGGGSALRPGEASLAHRGILLLEDLPEFAGAVLDALRGSLDHGTLPVSRAAATAVLPARFLLVATTWPCPCGTAGTTTGCQCSDAARARFTRRAPGPLAGHFALRVNIDANPPDNDGIPIPVPDDGESTADVAARVAAARHRAHERGVTANARLTSTRLAEAAQPTPEARRRIDKALQAGQLTAACADDVLRVALTIADLHDEQPPLRGVHVTAALALRSASLPPRS